MAIRVLNGERRGAPDGACTTPRKISGFEGIHENSPRESTSSTSSLSSSCLYCHERWERSSPSREEFLSISSCSPTSRGGKPRTLVLFACPRKKREKVRRDRSIYKKYVRGNRRDFFCFCFFVGYFTLVLARGEKKLDGERRRAAFGRTFRSFLLPFPSFFARDRRLVERRSGSQIGIRYLPALAD